MKFTLTIDMDNAAFEDPAELRRILMRLGDQSDLSNVGAVSPHGHGILDHNGNTVGHWEVS